MRPPLDYQGTVISIAEIDIQFSREGNSAALRHLLMDSPGHAVHTDAVQFGNIADRLHQGLIARNHSIQGPVRLDVIEWHAHSLQETTQSADLVQDDIAHLVGLQGHHPAAEPSKIWKAWVRTNCYARLGCTDDRGMNAHGITRVEAARDIRCIDVLEQAVIIPKRMNSE
jgi:hypothetical protein